MPQSTRLIHPIPPIYNATSRVLILGSFPSPASRTRGYNYAHPRNRFWPILATLFHEPPITNHRAFVLRHHLALWDVIAQCDIIGASDASIKKVIPNNIAALLPHTNIVHIFTTGTTAATLYRRHLSPSIALPVTHLPSPSPANAKMSLTDLISAYQPILTALAT
jgi:hypoxanthine-DNA glycosylase